MIENTDDDWNLYDFTTPSKFEIENIDENNITDRNIPFDTLEKEFNNLTL